MGIGFVSDVFSLRCQSWESINRPAPMHRTASIGVALCSSTPDKSFRDYHIRAAQLEVVMKQEHRTRSELLREALRSYIGRRKERS